MRMMRVCFVVATWMIASSHLLASYDFSSSLDGLFRVEKIQDENGSMYIHVKMLKDSGFEKIYSYSAAKFYTSTNIYVHKEQSKLHKLWTLDLVYQNGGTLRIPLAYELDGLYRVHRFPNNNHVHFEERSLKYDSWVSRKIVDVGRGVRRLSLEYDEEEKVICKVVYTDNTEKIYTLVSASELASKKYFREKQEGPLPEKELEIPYDI